MSKEKIILLIFVLIFAFMFIYNVMDSETGRVKELTYKTGERKNERKISKIIIPKLENERFSENREEFRMGKKGIFQPLSFRSKKRPKIEKASEPMLSAITLSSKSLTINVGSGTHLDVTDVSGNLAVTMTPPGIAMVEGISSPFKINCISEGVARGVVSDGNSSASFNVKCDLRPEEKMLATYLFLGFLEQEKDKTIFLSRKTDKEILIVKKGDILIKKNSSISQDYVIKNITNENITIASTDGSDILQISLIENEPLKK